MDEIEVVDEKPHNVRDQFAKMILATAAGFIASKLTENAYEALVNWRRNKTIQITE